MEFHHRARVEDRSWLWAISLAVVLHIVTFGLAKQVPLILDHRPLLDEVVTVDLVSLPEPAQPSTPAPARGKTVEPGAVRQKISPDTPQVPVAPDLESEIRSAPEAPVSLKPLKRKIKRARDTRLAEEKERQARERRQRELARQRALDQAREEQRRAEELARQAREELAAMLREEITAQASGPSSPKARINGNSTGNRQSDSLLSEQYGASVLARVERLWVLPAMRQWDSRLETVVVLTIRRDGSVVKSFVERSSKDPFFDQFVLKTIAQAQASPFPPFPRLLSENTIEIGLRFRPGELTMN
ncbi:energy transducer TonB [Desulfolithobacter sp.]